jgi:hypothetical protein
MYAVPFSAVAVTAAQDLWEIVPATAKPCVIHEINISQGSDAGDAEEEFLLVSIIRGYSTSGSGGSSPSKNPLDEASAAAGFTAEINNTTVATTGSPLTLRAEYWNIRTPYVYVPTPECRIRTAPATRTVVRITAPTDSLTMSGTMLVEEV